VASAAGGDLLIVAGGIGLAPLRGALLAALEHRERYRRVVVLAGARSPEELVFGRELDGWRGGGAEVEVTVDQAAAGWGGHVGVVTQLIGQASVDPAQTTALVCGPEVMMRLTARALRALGVPAAGIRVSLERNMRCGVAECGHCQLGPLLLCRDGPVISYEAARPLLAIREL
jgi:NAD(P)H-flavin reductase